MVDDCEYNPVLLPEVQKDNVLDVRLSDRDSILEDTKEGKFFFGVIFLCYFLLRRGLKMN